MFRESESGQTHYFGDGCPEHTKQCLYCEERGWWGEDKDFDTHTHVCAAILKEMKDKTIDTPMQ